MDLRKRIYIGTSIIVGFLIVLLIFFLYFRQTEPVTDEGVEDAVEVSDTPVATQQPTTSVIISPVGPAPQIAPEDNYVRQAARLFVERFGSYSNQNNNDHIANVLPLVTDNMAKWLLTQEIEQNGDYEGVTTKVIVSTIENVNESEAIVHVEVQEFIETRTTKDTNYRTGTVNLSFESGEWKVSSLFWEE